jgi:hypothetical protein
MQPRGPRLIRPGLVDSAGVEETLGQKSMSHSYYEIYLVRGTDGQDEGAEVTGSRRVLFENRYAYVSVSYCL